MKETILDVLMYMFQSYVEDNEEVELDKESLHKNLSEAGFADRNIEKAFAFKTFLHDQSKKNIEKTSDLELLDTININLMAPFILMREFKNKVNKGLIINILDERILRRVSTFSAYSISKSALSHLTELSAVSWGETIRVNGIAPGLILPPSGSGHDYLIKKAPNIPTKTHGSTSDILRGLDYLLDSPFVNGEILFIDGGESKKR